MKENEALDVIDRLWSLNHGVEFDSHDFIRVFIELFPVSYGQLLIKHGSVPSAHGEIAGYLRNNSETLGITRFGNITSLDIFNKEVQCVLWKKHDN